MQACLVMFVTETVAGTQAAMMLPRPRSVCHLEPIKDGVSLVVMSKIIHPIPAVSEKTSAGLEADDESLWAFFPILLGAAAICLLMFFFISPSFEGADPLPAPGILSAVRD